MGCRASLRVLERVLVVNKALLLELIEAFLPDLLLALAGHDLVPEAIDLELTLNDRSLLCLEVLQIELALMIAGLVLNLLLRVVFRNLLSTLDLCSIGIDLISLNIGFIFILVGTLCLSHEFNIRAVVLGLKASNHSLLRLQGLIRGILAWLTELFSDLLL